MTVWKPNTENTKNIDLRLLKPSLLWTLFLSIVGAFLSFYTLWHRETLLSVGTKTGSFCSISSTIDCDSVALSKYAMFWGIPTAGWALLFYVGLLLVAGWTYFSVSDSKGEQSASGINSIVRLNFAALIPTVALVCISFFVIKTLCILCLGNYLINLGLLVFALKLKNQRKALLPASTKIRFTAGFNIVLMVGLLIAAFIPWMVEQSLRGRNLNEDILNAVVASYLQSKENTFDLQDGPSFGPANAKITVVEFSDFQCPHCGLSAHTLPPLFKNYSSDLRVFYKNYPLDPSCNEGMQGGGHPLACSAAKMGWCVFKKKGSEAFFVYKKEIFDHQEGLSLEKIDEVAAKSGVELSQLKSCVQDPETHSAIARQIQEGKAAGLRGTPAVYVNGRLVPTGPNALAMTRILDTILK